MNHDGIVLIQSLERTSDELRVAEKQLRLPPPDQKAALRGIDAHSREKILPPSRAVSPEESPLTFGFRDAGGAFAASILREEGFPLQPRSVQELTESLRNWVVRTASWTIFLGRKGPQNRRIWSPPIPPRGMSPWIPNSGPRSVGFT